MAKKSNCGGWAFLASLAAFTAFLAAVYDPTFFEVLSAKYSINPHRFSGRYIFYDIVAVLSSLGMLYGCEKAIFKDSNRYSGLWTMVYLLVGIGCIVGLMATYSQSDDISGTDICSFVLSIAAVAMMAVLGYKLAKNYRGEIATLGKLMLYLPGACLILILLLSALATGMLEDVTRIVEQSSGYYKAEDLVPNSLVTMVVIIMILGAIPNIVLPYACFNVIRKSKEGMLAVDGLPQEKVYDMSRNNEASQSPTTGYSASSTASPSATTPTQTTTATPEKNRNKPYIVTAIILGILILAGIFFLIIHTLSQDSGTCTRSNSELVVSDDVAGIAELQDGTTITMMKDHTIKELSPEANWQEVGEAIVIFDGEGTSHRSIIDGYIYNGAYDSSTRQCWVEEWNVKDECLEDVGYDPVPQMGEQLVTFDWFL